MLNVPSRKVFFWRKAICGPKKVFERFKFKRSYSKGHKYKE